MLNLVKQLLDHVRYRGLLRRMPGGHALGHRAEDVAHRYLERRGWRIAARRYQPRGLSGDVDLIAWDGAALVMVEVKSRASAEHGDPGRNLSPQKERQLWLLARRFAKRAEVPWERVRFDLIEVVFRPKLSIRHERDIYATMRRPR